MSYTAARARHNALLRYRTEDDPEVLNARRDLRAAGLEDHIARALADAPPLTGDQLARLRLLLSDRSEAGAA